MNIQDLSEKQIEDIVDLTYPDICSSRNCSTCIWNSSEKVRHPCDLIFEYQISNESEYSPPTGARRALAMENYVRLRCKQIIKKLI